jgi:hypothetical protein
VTHVRYAPFAKLPAHAHTVSSSAYVYLNDSDPVTFIHENTTYGAITRPATTTGSFRLYHAVEDVHGVENPSAKPSVFLRVEFKTLPLDDRTLVGRFPRVPTSAGQDLALVQFSNAHLRVSRIVLAAGHAMPLSTSTAEPALLISLTDGRLELASGTATRHVALVMGKEVWFDAGRHDQLKNAGTHDTEFLRFDIKAA